MENETKHFLNIWHQQMVKAWNENPLKSNFEEQLLAICGNAKNYETSSLMFAAAQKCATESNIREWRTPYFKDLHLKIADAWSDAHGLAKT